MEGPQLLDPSRVPFWGRFETLFGTLWGPLGLVFGAIGRVLAALLVLLMRLGGSLDF